MHLQGFPPLCSKEKLRFSPHEYAYMHTYTQHTEYACKGYHPCIQRRNQDSLHMNMHTCIFTANTLNTRARDTTPVFKEEIKILSNSIYIYMYIYTQCTEYAWKGYHPNVQRNNQDCLYINIYICMYTPNTLWISPLNTGGIPIH